MYESTTHWSWLVVADSLVEMFGNAVLMTVPSRKTIRVPIDITASTSQRRGSRTVSVEAGGMDMRDSSGLVLK